MSIPLARLLDEDALRHQLQQGQALIPCFKKALTAAQEQLNDLFLNHEDIEDLIHGRATLVDALLTLAWDHFPWPQRDEICLMAVGGYGRGELHPYSDIDVLILASDAGIEHNREQIEAFVTFLWDTSLNIGHSVRSIAQCIDEAAKDITIVTNLIESRVLAGPESLFNTLMQEIRPEVMWSSGSFFKAKWEEQINRHKKYNNTEYNLEPNVKTCPGGLRDIQMVGWIAKRHYGVKSLDALLPLGFITDEDLDLLHHGQAFLWRVRYALHMIAKREEDRLIVDYQLQIAQLFGYEDNHESLAVEQFMKLYYRWALALAELNDMLLQHFDEAILRACEPEVVMELNPRFRLRNNYIEVTNERVFSQSPSALLEIFVLMGQHEHIAGVRATTIRLIRQNRHLIDDNFRADPRNRQLFIDLLRQPRRVASGLKRMKRYGVLGKYIPEFGQVIGQTQHDLFHIYTVDAHTILVIINMRRFSYPEAAEEFPLGAQLVKRLPKIELLYLAGLFHDIAKGRGGDHSKLGAEDAYTFCRNHGFNHRDANLVRWLVLNHLLMSSVAQRKDITDPEVVRDFALKVGDQLHLNYLYVLTVADIQATNPSLWNSWRASLMRQLYIETKRALRRGLETYIDRQEWIEETQNQAINRLETLGLSRDEVLRIWDNPGDDYFLRETANDIVWQTQAIAHHDRSKPLVLIKETTDRQFEGATQIFVFSPNRSNLFALTAACMEQLDLNIVDARIITSRSDYAMNTFFVLNADGQSIGADQPRINQIKALLEEQLASGESYYEAVKRRTPRRLKHFAIPTQTSMSTDLSKGQTVLEVITPDRPGLLARIGRIFADFGIQIQNAKIATLGERVEDVFFITDENGLVINDSDRCEAIQDAIKQILDKKAAE